MDNLVVDTPLSMMRAFHPSRPPPLSMTPFLSYTHVLHEKPALSLTPPHVDDGFALSTTRGGGVGACLYRGIKPPPLSWTSLANTGILCLTGCKPGWQTCSSKRMPSRPRSPPSTRCPGFLSLGHRSPSSASGCQLFVSPENVDIGNA